MRKLAELQREFALGLNAPRVEAGALVSFAGETGRAQHALGIYRGNIRANSAKALGGAYPVVEKIVGAEFFSGLASAYGQRFPSSSGDLNEYGESFAVFLTDFPPAAELPYLPDVARLEWQVHRAHCAADHEPFIPSRLGGLSPAEQTALRPALHPACSVLQSVYPVARIWEVHQASFRGEFEVQFPDHPTYALVFRPRYRVDVARISNAEAAFLLSCLDGKTLDVALTAARMSDEGFDLGSAMQRWVASSVIVDFKRDARRS